MSKEQINTMISEVFSELAENLKTGRTQARTKIGLTILGSEHGSEELIRGAELAAKKYKDVEIILIGKKADTELTIVEVEDESEMYKKMDQLLAEKKIQGAVTMHYPFPIGVSTVGKAVTPGVGKEVILATTTGTSSTNRIEGMVKNALYGIITAKALGNCDPTVGILNLDGARQVERALKTLRDKGYKISFADSVRSDGGCVMRGNDLLSGAADIMVMDTLTGNIMSKMLSSFTTGGSYESAGYGYGPGVGDNYDKIICILSRASGAPVVCEAIKYAADCAQGNLMEVAKEEFSKARKAGLDEILREITEADSVKAPKAEVKKLEKKVVTAQIPGVDILELDDAVAVLAEHGIYTEGGMGCTGPIILTAPEDFDKAGEILFEAKFIIGKPAGGHC